MLTPFRITPLLADTNSPPFYLWMQRHPYP